MTDKPTRRALLRPLHILLVAFGSAVFASVITLMTTRDLFYMADGVETFPITFVVFGATFIGILLIIALLLLAVDPDWRGRGIGRLLMQDWQTWAAAQGADEYFLEMRADNDAVHLYLRSGFSEVGRRAAYYRGNDGKMRDAITMRRTQSVTGSN